LDTSTVSNIATQIQNDADLVLETIKGVDPALTLPVDAAESIVNVFGGLINKALAGWSAASGIPITQASVLALLPDNTPLDAPTK
jgi:hypothetical protein